MTKIIAGMAPEEHRARRIRIVALLCALPLVFLIQMLLDYYLFVTRVFVGPPFSGDAPLSFWILQNLYPVCLCLGILGAAIFGSHTMRTVLFSIIIGLMVFFYSVIFLNHVVFPLAGSYVPARSLVFSYSFFLNAGVVVFFVLSSCCPQNRFLHLRPIVLALVVLTWWVVMFSIQLSLEHVYYSFLKSLCDWSFWKFQIKENLYIVPVIVAWHWKGTGGPYPEPVAKASLPGAAQPLPHT